MRAVRRTVVGGVVLGALAALAGTAAAGAGAPSQANQVTSPFNVLSTTKVGPSPNRVTYGFGAAWTLNGNGSVSRCKHNWENCWANCRRA